MRDTSQPVFRLRCWDWASDSDFWELETENLSSCIRISICYRPIHAKPRQSTFDLDIKQLVCVNACEPAVSRSLSHFVVRTCARTRGRLWNFRIFFKLPLDFYEHNVPTSISHSLSVESAHKCLWVRALTPKVQHRQHCVCVCVLRINRENSTSKQYSLFQQYFFVRDREEWT